jgi:ubiquinone/menaquinone biosynthesis C-methylase UbiE
MNDVERVRGQWQKYAPRYDRDMGFLERVLFGDGRQWVCSQASGDTLEVAIGTGRNLPFYPDGVRLTGLDFSSAMLDVARARAVELGRDVELREGDAQALPFSDSSFDSVVCTLGLCGFPDERIAIGEMHRVLRPGGMLLLLDHVDSHVWLVHHGQRLLERVSLRMLGDYLTRRPLPLVKQAGFVVERKQRLKAGIVERLAARKPA